MQHKTIAVIGAGLVGLATAYRLKESMPDATIIILEKESGPARHQSSHNSGVIHSGIYYKPGSLKAKNCVDGYHYLIDFCKKHQVPFKITGKLIVAINEQEELQLPVLQSRAVQNGLEGVRLLSAKEISKIEPAITAKSGLWVPQTGIVDFPKLADKFCKILISKGVQIYFNQKVINIQSSSSSLEIQTDKEKYKVDVAINCAGLYSDKIARMAGAHIEHQIVPFRGEYFMLEKSVAEKIKGLIYPVPHPGLPFLGVHLTRMIHGEVEAGPNAILALKREGYQLSSFSFKDTWETIRFIGFWKMISNFKKIGFKEWQKTMSKKSFTKSVQQMMPSIREEDLTPATSGVRAQAIRKDGSLIDDFLIVESPNMLHICNAPSPAATSCLSIGKTISEMIEKKFKQSDF